MINIMTKTLNFCASVRPMKMPNNMFDFSRKFARLDASEAVKHKQKYLKTLENDLFDSGVAQKKEELFEEIKQSGYEGGLEAYILKTIKPLKTPGMFYRFLFHETEDTLVRYYETKYGKYTEPTAEIIERFENDIRKFSFSLLKFFVRKTDNPEVLKIKDKLLSLGIKEFEPGNDLKKSRAILNGIKLAKLKGDKLPKRIVVSDVQLGGTLAEAFPIKENSSLQISSTNFENFVKDYMSERVKRIEKKIRFKLLPKDIRQELRRVLNGCRHPDSSDDFIVLHEIGHLNSTKKVLLNEVKLTPKELETILNLTEYTPKGEIVSEGFAELFAKARFFGTEKLTEHEKALFLRLGGKL